MSPKVFTPDPSKRGKAALGQSPGLRNFREKADPKPPETVSFWMRPEFQDRAAFQAEAARRHPNSTTPGLMTRGWGSNQQPS